MYLIRFSVNEKKTSDNKEWALFLVTTCPPLDTIGPQWMRRRRRA